MTKSEPIEPESVTADPESRERRSFLRGSALVGGMLAAASPLVMAGCGGEALPDPEPAPDFSFDLEEVSLVELQRRLEAAELTSRDLTQSYLDRIAELDREGPRLQAVLETNPEALAVAESLDEERRAGKVRGPLHGIPILLKDNLDTADQMSTTAGSRALMGSTPARDSFVAQRLREAGAVLLGKANLSEWANFRSPRSSSGWSARGGQCKNPYALNRSPCGSSSGSGAAVAANFCAAAIGTETDGSIVCPSSANSVVGIKPTLGLVSRAGIIPIAHSQDTAGPMTRTVADAATLLGALTGVDPADEATAASEGNAHADYTRFLDPAGLEGARIGVARQFFGFHPRVDELMEEALGVMAEKGAVLVDPASTPGVGEFSDGELLVLLYEFKADLNRYLEDRGGDVKSLEELIRFNEDHRETEMPYFGQEFFHLAQEKGPLSTDEYRQALARNRRVAGPEGIDAVMEQHRLDALVAPTGAPPWTIDLVNGDHFLGGSSSLAAVAGYPSVCVPAGYIDGLPVGLSLFGRAWSEPVLLRIAYAFEQATVHRRAPRFLPTGEIVL